MPLSIHVELLELGGRPGSGAAVPYVHVARALFSPWGSLRISFSINCALLHTRHRSGIELTCVWSSTRHLCPCSVTIISPPPVFLWLSGDKKRRCPGGARHRATPALLAVRCGLKAIRLAQSRGGASPPPFCLACRARGRGGFLFLVALLAVLHARQ